ncbi:CocE/NonD family hydrolase [Neopusillimonas aromaticivorans]|uniref:CocE/NonD family hydrolase n=1 Tax=Neopusillimonas aromaticivorans TaxID=2979868 RepID=UPI00259321CE|nr:CocE/NonD family hydrolase [Neopusillimonas aromaticivorans]WJJ94996.1 CocE/NonD family hydrolase [Neopusillimonas aromaticivorans]
MSKKSWSNGKVGMYGISWSAFNALMTAHRKPPALKAIIAAHGSTDLFYNDVHYIDGALHIDSYAHQIDTDNSMPQSPDYRIDEAYFQNRFDKEPWLFTWLRQQKDGDFWRKESVKFKAPLEVPAYLIGGLLDGYRDFVMEVSQSTKAPFIAEIGPWNHAWPEYGEPGPNYEWRQRALRWWDYWLKDIDNGILDEPRWTVFMRTGHPRH